MKKLNPWGPDLPKHDHGKLNPWFHQERHGLNPAFSYMGENLDNSNEKGLIEHLIIEQFQQFGNRFIYIPRRHMNVDLIFGEEGSPVLDKAFEIEMMMNDPAAGVNDSDSIAAFGFTMLGMIDLSVSWTRLKEEFARAGIEQVEAEAGDIIYFPMTLKFFEVKFADYDEHFYIAGKPMVTRLRCQLFDRQSEIFDTGNEGIDEFMDSYDEMFVQPFSDNSMTEAESRDQALSDMDEPSYWPALTGRNTREDDE